MAINDLKISLAAHEAWAQKGGLTWGHVEDMNEILALVKRTMDNEA